MKRRQTPGRSKRHWMGHRLTATSLVALSSLVGAFASCAETSEGDTTPERSVLPEGSTPAAPSDATAEADPGADSGCDAADPSCTTHVVSCADVAWCGVATNVSPFYVFTAVWGTSKNDVWAVGSGGTIVHYDGNAWAPTPTGVKNTFYSIHGSGPNDVWVSSDGLVLLHSTGFHGATTTWTTAPTGLTEGTGSYITAVWASSPDDVRIGGRAYSATDPVTKATTCDQFTKYATDDGGVGWQSRGGTATINGIWGSSPTNLWMVADNAVYVPYQRGLTLHGTPADAGAADASVDAGAKPDPLTWTAVDSQAQVTLYGVWGSSPADVWSVGAVGTIRHITPTDVRWQEVDSPTTQTLRAIWGSGPNDIWIVGDSGTILHFDGTSFGPSTAQFPIGRKPDLHGVWGSGPNDVWIVGDGVALHYTGPKGGAQ